MELTINITAFLLLISTTVQGVTNKELFQEKQSSDTVEEFLANAEVIRLEELKIGITRPRRIILRNDNIQKRALFKSYNTGVQENGGIPLYILLNRSDRYQHERAAYVLNELLGINMIPETVIRKVDGEKGSVQLWVENSLVHRSVINSKSGALEVCPFKKQIAMMNIFDMLIHNDDRNNGNILYTLSDCRLWMIDHSRAFRVKRNFPDRLLSRKVKLTRELADKLISLDSTILRRSLGRYLVRSQIKAILKRRDKIISRWKDNGKPIYKTSRNQNFFRKGRAPI